MEREGKKYRFAGRTLSESYQIKQTIYVMIVMKIILKAYICVVALCTIVLSFNGYALWTGLWDKQSVYFKSLANVS